MDYTQSKKLIASIDELALQVNLNDGAEVVDAIRNLESTVDDGFTALENVLYRIANALEALVEK